LKTLGRDFKPSRYLSFRNPFSSLTTIGFNNNTMRTAFLAFLLATNITLLVSGNTTDNEKIEAAMLLRSSAAAENDKIQQDDSNNKQLMNIAVLVADGFELLDAMGPFEALKEVQNRYYKTIDLKRHTGIDDDNFDSGIRCRNGTLDIKVVLASFGKKTVVSSSGIQIQSQFDLLQNNTITKFDLLVLGAGSVNEFDATSLEYLKHHHDQGGSILTVCTGAKYAAMLGFLDHQTATTNSLFLQRFRTLFPLTHWISLADNLQQRFVVSTPQITTTAGITAGIDGILYQIYQWCGWEVAEATRECLEWPLLLEKNDTLVIAGAKAKRKNDTHKDKDSIQQRKG